MKRIPSFPVLATLAVLAVHVTGARADDFSDNFNAHLDQPSLDALAADVGALMGGSSFHEGQALGFPLGFDFGLHVPVIGVSDDNGIQSDNGSSAHAVWAQAEYGLPGRVNIIGRFGRLEDADLIGGGLRWGLFRSKAPGVPSVSISALYGRLDHAMFEGETFTGNLVASFEVPFVHPYIGVGYDRTRIDLSGTPAAPLGRGRGYRVEAGINVSVIPFTYLTLGGGIANGERLGHIGLGLRI